MTLAVPVGNHLFTPEALQKALAVAESEMKPDASHAVVGSIDASGAKAAVIFGSADGHWKAEAAVSHDWTGETSAGGKFIASW